MMKKSILIAVLTVVSLSAIADAREAYFDDGKTNLAMRADADPLRGYLAKGVFYYWFYGLEKTAGRLMWTGCDPLDCFVQDLWNERPEDFCRRVLDRSRTVRRGGEEDLRRFKEALLDVTIGRSEESFARNHIYAVSDDPNIAEDVVNSCMDELFALEYSRRLAGRRMACERLAFELYRAEQGCAGYRIADDGREVPLSEEDVERARRTKTATEDLLRRTQRSDVRTNMMFKVLSRASAPTNRMDGATVEMLSDLSRAWEKRVSRESERKQKLPKRINATQFKTSGNRMGSGASDGTENKCF